MCARFCLALTGIPGAREGLPGSVKLCSLVVVACLRVHSTGIPGARRVPHPTDFETFKLCRGRWIALLSVVVEGWRCCSLFEALFNLTSIVVAKIIGMDVFGKSWLLDGFGL